MQGRACTQNVYACVCECECVCACVEVGRHMYMHGHTRTSCVSCVSCVMPCAGIGHVQTLARILWPRTLPVSVSGCSSEVVA